MIVYPLKTNSLHWLDRPAPFRFNTRLASLTGCSTGTRHLSGQIAQSVEQGTENPRVGGSIPPLATIFFF